MSRENGDKRENIEESSTLMNDHVFVIPTSINAINNKLLWRDAVKQVSNSQTVSTNTQNASFFR